MDDERHCGIAKVTCRLGDAAPKARIRVGLCTEAVASCLTRRRYQRVATASSKSRRHCKTCALASTTRDATAAARSGVTVSKRQGNEQGNVTTAGG